MPSGPAYHPYDTIARQWYDLAVRRRDYYVELYNSGRWARYYDEEHFLERMQDVMRAVENWGELAGMRPEIENPDRDTVMRPAA